MEPAHFGDHLLCSAAWPHYVVATGKAESPEGLAQQPNQGARGRCEHVVIRRVPRDQPSGQPPEHHLRDIGRRTEVQLATKCRVASDCKGMLPMFCRQCPNGAAICAHYDCVDGQCQVRYCP